MDTKNKLKPRVIPIKNNFIFKKISYKDIEEGMLISFNYYGDTVNDYYPFVYIVEKKLDRVYGLNLRYIPTEINKIINNKNIELNKQFKNQISILKKENKGTDIDENKALSLLKKQTPISLLKYFEHGITQRNQEKILRNYLPKKMKAINMFIFKVK